MVVDKELVTEFATYLEKNAHLEGMTTGSIFLTKFYTVGDVGYRVVSSGDEISFIAKIPPEEIKKILSCNNLDFGEW